MARPGHNNISEDQVDHSLETLQSALLHQLAAEPAEAIGGLVVAKARAGDHGKPCIGDARAMTVAMLKTEIDCLAGDEGSQVRIGEHGRRCDLG